MFTKSFAVLAAAVLTAAAGSSNAAITAVGGSTTWLLTPPTSAMPGALAGGTAYAWNEQTGVTVSNLNVNIVGNTGVYTGNTPNFGTLTGTFDSHFIHFDNASGINFVAGSVTFSQRIVAVIYQDVFLDLSDATFGSFGTTYPTSMPFRSFGPALGATVVALSPYTINFNIFANAAQYRLEEFRVITETVPTPGSLALLGMGGVMVGRRRR